MRLRRETDPDRLRRNQKIFVTAGLIFFAAGSIYLALQDSPGDPEQGTRRVYGRESGSVSGLTPATPARIAADLEARPDYRDTMAAFRTYYPAEYRAFLERTSAAFNRDGQAGTDREISQSLNGLLISRFAALSRAPAADLQRVAAAYEAVAQAMQSYDVALCGQWISAGLPAQIRSAPEVTAQFSRVAAEQIRASRAGENVPAAATRTASAADRQAFRTRMRAINLPAATLLEDSSALNAAPPFHQCSAVVTMYAALASLPAEASANMMVDMLRSEFGAGARAD